ncbi:Hypothetical predicted protein, partial [Paramuricea clavata]
KRLSDCLISEKIVLDLIECGQWCLSHDCQSFNYGEKEESRGLYTCQLNYCTKKDRLALVDRKFEYYEMVPQLSECESVSEPSFSMLFPRHSIKDYVEVDDPDLPELSAFSICAWAKFVKNADGTILSYAVQGGSKKANEIAIWCYRTKVIFSITNVWTTTYNSLLSDGFWHSICLTWSNVDGNLAVYKDNVMTDQASGVVTGKNISGGGRWVLGQDQDSVGGGFAIQDAFQGELAEVNVWGRVLTKQENKRLPGFRQTVNAV